MCADTVTTAYALTKPEVGASEDTWGTKINTDLDTLDTVVNAIGGKTAAATLSYADAAKIATTATGVDVTGNVVVSGTVDGVDIAARDAILTSTTVTADAALPKAGGTMTGDLSFGDNDKAIFGAGSDLQIYHDGSHSRIDEQGTGVLFLQTNGNNIQLNKGTSENMLVANVDGSVDLYYDNSKKLATTATGIDVTGTATMGAMNVTSSLASGTGIGASAANGNLRFYSGGSQLVTLNTSGSVGIGTNSIDGTLHVHTASAGTVTASTQADDLVIENSTEGGMTIITPDAQSARIRFTSPSTNNDVGGASIFYRQNINKISMGTEVAGGILALKSGAGTEGIILDSSGNVGIGTSSTSLTNSRSVVYVGSSGGVLRMNHSTANGSGDGWIEFGYNGTKIGSITQNGTTATAYNTSSDYRLKTDAQPMTGASARVQALNPVNFEWIASGDRVDGFLAHEAQAIVPEAVTGTKDAMRDEEYEVTSAVLDDDGNETTAAVMGTRNVPDMQGIDQSKLVPLLTAALQEALTKIDAMETRITALEGA